jgi:DNA-binding winged helix-turn-helix (wHTH) protein/tetratricopeptide (TPR) repeat protein
MDLQRGFRVGDREVFPHKGEVSAGGRSIHVEPKVMEVLLVLAARAPDVVLRQTLLDTVWGSRAAVSDEPLTRCIAQLRLAFDDSAREPQFIQTVPKRGYRLMQAVRPLQVAPPAELPPSVPARDRAVDDTALPQPRRLVQWSGGLAVVALAVAVVGLGSGLVPGPWRSQASVGMTDHPEALRAYREAVTLIAERDGLALQEAIRTLEEAVAYDDGFGMAYVQLARANALLPTYWGFANQADSYGEAQQWIGKISEKAPDAIPFSHGVTAFLAYDDWDWTLAHAQFANALVATPADADLMQWYSNFLATVGRQRESVTFAEKAVALDDSHLNNDRLGIVYLWIDENDKAVQQFARMHERFPSEDPNPDGQIVLKIREAGAGRASAWDEVEDLLRAHVVSGGGIGRDAWISPFLDALRGQGPRQDAIAAVAAARQNGWLEPKYAFGAWVYLEAADQAFELAFELAEFDRQSLNVQFLFTQEAQFMRDREADFRRLLEQIGLPAYWQRFACPDESIAGIDCG